MQIASDRFERRVVKARQIGGGMAERRTRLRRGQIAEVLADENLRADAERHGILQWAPTASMDGTGAFK